MFIRKNSVFLDATFYTQTVGCNNPIASDTGFMLIAYNLRRILNILGVVKFTELLSKLDNSINKLFRFIGSIISAIIDSRMHYNGNPKQTLNFQLYDA
jgi:hypothetical protein